jgi:hypothetical protein
MGCLANPQIVAEEEHADVALLGQGAIELQCPARLELDARHPRIGRPRPRGNASDAGAAHTHGGKSSVLRQKS